MKSFLKASTVLTLFLSVCADGLFGQQYVISTVAGGAPPPSPVAALSAWLGYPTGIAVDAAGNIFFATLANCVYKLDTQGILTLVAGNSRDGYAGDGGLATNAQLTFTGGVTPDGAGNLFVAQGNAGGSKPAVRKISPAGIVTTVAGTGRQAVNGFSGEGTPAVSADLYLPNSVVVDGAGNVFIADAGSARVLRVSPAGIVATFAGNGTAGFSGDGGPATSASVIPLGLAVDNAGRLLIVDASSRIRRVSDGSIMTVAGNGTPGASGDGGPATSAQLRPIGVAVDRAGNIYTGQRLNLAGQSSSGIRMIAPNGTISTVYSGGVDAMTADQDGSLFIVNLLVLLRVSPGGAVTTIAGSPNRRPLGEGGPATLAHLYNPQWPAADSAGSYYFVEAGVIRKVNAAGIVSTIAGTGVAGFSGDGGLAVSAQVSSPQSLAADMAGNLYFADAGNLRIRRISTSGIISTFAGGALPPVGAPGFAGDGGPATSAQLGVTLWGVAVDETGNVFIADGNSRVRKVDRNGIITTVAGNGSSQYSGDGAPAINAGISPHALVVGAGNLFIADGNRIRKVDSSGIVTTVAGDGTVGFSGDGGQATKAQLGGTLGLALDASGSLFVADNNRIRKVAGNGVITTVAGSGNTGYSGDGGPATGALLYNPVGLAIDTRGIDTQGNVLVADTANNAIRLLRTVAESVIVGAVQDAASETAAPISPGKIVVVYGAGLGPVLLSPQSAGTAVTFNGIAAPIIYTSATQIAAIAPYGISGSMAQVVVSYQGRTSAAFSVPLAPSAPGIFTLNQTGAGQAAAVNQDGTINTAANPEKIGRYISLYGTGEGQTMPAGVDGSLAGTVLPHPILPVTVTIGGLPATITYAGAAPGEVAGLMQVNVQIPVGIRPGGYVPVVLQVGTVAGSPGVTIAVAN